MNRSHRMAALTAGCALLAACRMTTEPLLYLDPVPAGTFTTDASVYLAHRIAGAGDSSRYQFTVISRF
ncbi:MAG: hypothetical protein ACHQQ3_14905, partial [Gemmatimonadales bacterium]